MQNAYHDKSSYHLSSCSYYTIIDYITYAVFAVSVSLLSNVKIEAYQGNNKKEDRSHSFNIGWEVQPFTVKQAKERHVVVFKNVILSEHVIVMSTR